MSDSENLDYLRKDFDPWSMTVPRIRSVLVKHNVQYPSTAKKPQLVELFNDQVAPQAKKILARNARAKRSSKGIVDMGGSQDTDTFDEDEVLPPPRRSKSPRRSRSPRKSSTVQVKNEAPEDRPLFSRQSRSASRQLPQASDTDTGADTARSSRRGRTATPQIKSEEDVLFRKTDDESVFTDDNPFQSGSSPPPARTPGTRRRTPGSEGVKSASRHSRRSAEGRLSTSTDEESSKHMSFEIPLSKLQRHKTPDPPTVDVGEEFTPEEQLELSRDIAQGKTVVPRRSAPPSRRMSLATPFWALILTMLSAYAAWYRQEKMAVGYCGLGREAKQLLPPDFPVPEWAVPFVEPQCEPCPPHAYCYENFVLRCETDFILRPHPLSLGGLVPVPPTCEPDGEKVRRVKAVADKAVEELRERRAKWECGELVDEQGQKEETPAMEEESLKNVIDRKRSKKPSKKLSKAEFDDLWVAALGEVKARDEIEVIETREADSGDISNTYLTSTSLARIPFTCAVRRGFVKGLERYRLAIGLLIGLACVALYGRSRYRESRATAAQIPALVDLVLDRLLKQKDLGDEDVDDPWLFLPNLRDDVLRSMHSLSQREKIWQRVKTVVEQNSNVRTSQREGRNGEVGRAWEWIGPMPGDVTRRRKSGRVSWGPDVKPESTEMSEYKTSAYSRWEESRPIY